MTLLEGTSCIDVNEQELTPCHWFDAKAWQSVNQECASRRLELCSKDQYMKAYTDASVVTKGSQKYGYTRTTCPNGKSHKLMNDQFGDLYGCHANKGCFPDRYYRCCSKGKY